MRISDWSSDVCSSDLHSRQGLSSPSYQIKPSRSANEVIAAFPPELCEGDAICASPVGKGRNYRESPDNAYYAKPLFPALAPVACKPQHCALASPIRHL